MNTSTKTNVKKICLTGVMAALVTVCTAFVKIPTGINSGYVHFGDSMVYISGCILGPWALLASAIGGALADVLAGAPQWAVATAVIKALNSVPFVIMSAQYRKKNDRVKVVNKYTAPMTVVSGVITVLGYLVAEGIMYSFPSAVGSVVFSIVQAVGAAVIFFVVGKVFDKANLQKYI